MIKQILKTVTRWRRGGMTHIRVSGNMPYPKESITISMQTMHSYLMHSGFPYNSVSVIYRPQDLGLHCIFSNSVADKVTDEVKARIKAYEFTYSINEK